MNSIRTVAGFTLVELIVVMTILTILWTMGFVSYLWKAWDARDSIRISELRNIEKSLELYAIDNWNYPNPDNGLDITLEWNTIWTQWTFWDSVYRTVRRLSNKPMDPLYDIEYSYSLLHNKSEYQISTIFEGWSVSFHPLISQTYAADSLSAYTAGNYNQRISYIKQPWNDIILALPSITTSSNDFLDIQGIISNNNLVIHGKSNLAENYNLHGLGQSWWVETNIGNIIVFSGSLNELITYGNQKILIQNLQNAYQNSSTLSAKGKAAYQKLININLDSIIAVQAYIDFLSENNVWGMPRL